MRILIANRGEIARRIIRTAHELGHQSIAVFNDPDRGAPHTVEATITAHIGPADLSQSYLSIDTLIATALKHEADAVHPGYGFLAERLDFAQAVIDAGMAWVGPSPTAIATMGSKIEARRLAADAGVPLIPGFDTSQDPAELLAAAKVIGFPVLIKAAFGGGGKGIRVVNAESEFGAALSEASSEAERSFGDGSVIVERFVQSPRHIEVQIIGDQHGNVIELGTRECSLQRRYQKVIEEAPAPNLSDRTDTGLRSDALLLARSIGYDSAGTVEFVVDGITGEHFFLEMNTRLQVEHPVTEAITGLDLVALMLRVAEGEPLPLAQGDITYHGHAFEARINAEDPAAGFIPQTGTVLGLAIPPDVRWDAAIEPGSVVSPHFDAMIAKLITHGSNRTEALRRLSAALGQVIVAGVPTNTGFLRWLAENPSVQDASATTRFIDMVFADKAPSANELTSPDLESAAAIAAHHFLVAEVERRSSGNLWEQIGPYRPTPHRASSIMTLRHRGGERLDVEPLPQPDTPHQTLVDIDQRVVAVNVEGHNLTFTVPTASDLVHAEQVGRSEDASALVAPFPALVVEVVAVAGAEVKGGDTLVVIEAMKMLHSLTANGDGTIASVAISTGDTVEGGATLVTFEPTKDQPNQAAPVKETP